MIMFDKKTNNLYAFIWSNTYNSEKQIELRITPFEIGLEIKKMF